MRQRTCTLLALGLAAAAVSAGPASAKNTKLTPAKVKQIKKARKSFDVCRKEALSELKAGAATKKKFALMLDTCKERFPGASLYISCKKAAMKTAEAKSAAPDGTIAQCKRYLVAASFDPDVPLPVFVEQGQLYFAGVGLNKPAPLASLSPPNFDCESLAAVADNPSSAQYFLFGNHPRTFAGLADLKGPALAKTLRFTKPAAKGVDVAGFGRVFGDPKTSSGVVFFPSAACHFEADTGDTFAGISAYYLLDGPADTATPYFGIAYYKQEQKAVTTPKLVAGLLKELGSAYKSYSKSSQVTFIAAASVSETDDEDDPKNLCRQPRQHRFVAVIQSRKDAPNQPEYMLLANVKNLCDFGDKVGKRLTN
jgi:hypothetical protein